MKCLKYNHFVSHYCTVSSNSKTTGSRTDNGYLFAGFGSYLGLFHGSHLGFVIGDEPFKSSDGDGSALLVEYAHLLTLFFLGTHPTTDSWEGVGLLDLSGSLYKLPFPNEGDELRNLHLCWTSLYTERLLTQKTPFRLCHRHLFGVSQGYFVEVFDPLLGILARHIHSV